MVTSLVPGLLVNGAAPATLVTLYVEEVLLKSSTPVTLDSLRKDLAALPAAPRHPIDDVPVF